jgi:hypothetical protein
MTKIYLAVLTRPHPGRVELRAVPPDVSMPLSGQLLAVAEEHGRGWTVFTRGGTQQIVTLDGVVDLLFGSAQ